MDLFEQDPSVEAEPVYRPLADRMRPANLAEYVGQSHLLGDGCLLRQAVEEDRLFSMIFWGPPGSGKTTLALLIAQETKAHFIRFSAVLSGVKEIRAVVEEAKDQLKYHGRRTILFVDEIHRFNKSQQDAFLPHVESGLFTFIGGWNSFLWPLIVTNSDHLRTIQVGLSRFNQEFGTRPDLLMAASTLAIAPLVALFFVAQNQFIQGIARTGLKS